MPAYGGGDALEDALGVRQENGYAAFAVLGLGKQIRCNPIRFGGVVGYDEDFARTGQKIDADGSEDLAFCFDDKGVSRAKDLLHLWDCACAESKRSDCLCSSYAIDLCGAALGQSPKQGILHGSILCRWGYGNDFGTPAAAASVQVMTAVETRGAVPPGT